MATCLLFMDKNNNIDEPKENSPNQCSTNKNTTFGRSGPLIGILPIVLSDFTSTIECPLRYKYPIISIKTLENKLSIKKFKLIKHNKYILISGYILKTALVISKNSTAKRTFTLPFSSTIKIKYSTYPEENEKLPNSKLYKHHSQSKICSKNFYNINCNLISINLTEKIIKLDNPKSNSLLHFINLDILLTQNQNVFIPEPEGDVNIIEEIGTGDRYNPKAINIGVSDNKDLLGKVFK